MRQPHDRHTVAALVKRVGDRLWLHADDLVADQGGSTRIDSSIGRNIAALGKNDRPARPQVQRPDEHCNQVSRVTSVASVRNPVISEEDLTAVIERS